MRWCRLVVIVALPLATAACGASHPAAPSGGKTLFTQACGACHTVSGVSPPSKQGGDLLRVHLKRPVMIQFAREMPMRRRLTPVELDAVVDYVLGLQHRAG
jgi:mono/diheme cytochrome c family protein